MKAFFQFIAVLFLVCPLPPAQALNIFGAKPEWKKDATCDLYRHRARLAKELVSNYKVSLGYNIFLADPKFGTVISFGILNQSGSLKFDDPLLIVKGKALLNRMGDRSPNIPGIQSEPSVLSKALGYLLGSDQLNREVVFNTDLSLVPKTDEEAKTLPPIAYSVKCQLTREDPEIDVRQAKEGKSTGDGSLNDSLSHNQEETTPPARVTADPNPYSTRV